MATTIGAYYKILKVLYGWLVDEEELDADPMAKMMPPIVPGKQVPVVPADGLKRLFAACAGTSFEARRDTALIMLLLDTGARRAEMVGLKLTDVDLDLDVLLVLRKGRRERTLPFGRKAGQALDRYLRARSRHKHAQLSWLWLGQKGRLSEWGLVQMLRRRGAQADLPGLHPHQLVLQRRTTATVIARSCRCPKTGSSRGDGRSCSDQSVYVDKAGSGSRMSGGSALPARTEPPYKANDVAVQLGPTPPPGARLPIPQAVDVTATREGSMP